MQPRDRFLGIADQQHQWSKSLQRHGQNIWELMPQQLSAWARGPGTAIRESQSRLRRRWTPVSSNLQYDRLGGTGPGSLRCALLALQAEVFEETVSMDYLFEGIPTVPPRKDMDHMVTVWHSSSLLNAHSVQLSVCDTCLTVHTGLEVTQVRHNSQVSSPSAQVFFCSGCRYRVTAYREWTAAQVRTPWQGGLAPRLLCRPPAPNAAVSPIHVQLCMPCSWSRRQLVASRPALGMQVKQALWDGGIRRSNKPKAVRNTPGLQQWQDLVRLGRPCQ